MKTKRLFSAFLLVSLAVILFSCNNGEVAETQPETTAAETESLTEHVHEYTEELKAPTCTEPGYFERKCSCGDVQRTDTSPTGHTYGAWETLSAPTCAADGKRAASCTVCGEKLEEAIPAGESSLDGKKVMFAGNSLTYYGEIVINNDGSPTRNKGVFEKIAETFGDKVKVTNFTYLQTHRRS